ncbi:MAG: hypothetical protein BECKG1743F_GA0114225_111201 [Candidatus Kentron sp. G]|nr:MAG: hypothetical protein BECKG1743F_GA0114225_111201 [Candidatus Kentron sp. G]VFN07744.1 MAG: hypothetical protein BECKG1743E_GA0114224_112861 [Candidatus Kentron sp. G]
MTIIISGILSIERNRHNNSGSNRLYRKLLRPSKFEGHCPMIRHGCQGNRMIIFEDKRL